MKASLVVSLYLALCWTVTVIASRGRSHCDGGKCNYRNKLRLPPIQPVDASLLKCCACGTATYRVTFIGMWSSQSHPRHFPGPMSSWSSLIGGSHSNDYIMWRLGDLASPGVQMVSEMGSTWKLEQEMRDQRKNVLSIAKAPGLWWGVGQSKPTMIRADKTHNLFSAMSRIIPSPDWYVGVDRLNLCDVNCTWKNEEMVDLYPLDAGTDDGINFISVNSKSKPQQPITRITTRLHNHRKASFYLSDNDVIRPFARLKLEKVVVSGSCSRIVKKSPAPTKPARIDCKVSRWSSWTPCSVTCGEGKQTRGRAVIVHPKYHGIECPHLYEHKKCYMKKCQDSSKCVVSVWSGWGSCLGTCGVGVKTRTRIIINKPAKSGRCPVLTKKRRCRLTPCQGDRKTAKTVDCQVSKWSRWSKCNKRCRGKKRRSRYILRKATNGGKPCPHLREKKKCNRRKCPKN